LIVAAESDTRWLPMCVKAPSMVVVVDVPPVQHDVQIRVRSFGAGRVSAAG
jgi:hypothetical protein